jgi:Flp pilus assembly protein TadD
MRIQTGHSIAFSAAAAVLCLILSGCAATKPTVQQASQPNEYSAYFYSAATVLAYSNQLETAERIFRLALTYDPGALSIKQAIYNTMYNRLSRQEIPLPVFSAYADSLLKQNGLNQLMLEQYYNVLVQSGNNRKAKAVLEIYLKGYSSARAYTSLYYLEQQQEGKSRVELLDKAFKLAGNDPEFLTSLGYLYLAIDSTLAESVWQKALQFDETSRSAAALWDLYAKQNKPVKLRKLYASFYLPQDRDKLEDVLTNALTGGEYQSLLDLQDLVVASREPRLLEKILQAGWLAGDDLRFGQSLAALQNLRLGHQDEQFVDFYAALSALKQHDDASVLSRIARLDGINTLNELVGGFRATFLSGNQSGDASALSLLKSRLRKAIMPATEKQLPWQVKDYLLAVLDSLSFDNLPGAPDDVTKACALFYYDNGRRTYDTYLWLAQHYQKTKSYINLRALLRNALEEYPEDAALLNWLGYSYVNDEYNLEEAEIFIRRALQLSPDNPYYLDSLAWLYFVKGDYQTALKLMELPARLEKMPSEIAYHLARICVALDNYKAAIDYLNLVIEINDDPEYVKDARVILQKLTQ